MISYLREKSWSPYAVGTGIGLLTIILAYTMNRFLGASSAYEGCGIFIESLLSGNQTISLVDWKTIFVVSIFFGSFVSSKLSGTQAKNLPSIWTKTFGNSKLNRYIAAFFGGMLVLFGARIAGGCTSGHAISGGMQLALTGWFFVLVLFVSGIITAFILYKR